MRPDRSAPQSKHAAHTPSEIEAGTGQPGLKTMINQTSLLSHKLSHNTLLDERRVYGAITLALTAALTLTLYVGMTIFGFEDSALIAALASLLIFVGLRPQIDGLLERQLNPERLAYQRVMEACNQVIRHAPDRDRLLDYIAQMVHKTLGAETVLVWRYDFEDSNLALSCWAGGDIDSDLAAMLPVDVSLDTLPRRQSTCAVTALPESALKQGLLALGVQSLTFMELQGEIIGVIGVRLSRPDRDTFRLLDLMAGQSALAVKNASLITDLEDTLSKLQLAYRRTIDAQDEERRSLAVELHDDILGRLTTMTLALRNSRDLVLDDPAQVQEWLGMLAQETQAVNQRLREITQGLHPSVLTDLGLLSALQAHMDARARQPRDDDAQPKTVVTLTAQGFNGGRIKDQKLERDLYFVARQAVDNALNHAEAAQIYVHLRWHTNKVSLTVQDNGRGMKQAPEVLMGQNGRLGLLSMHERVLAWQGQLHFDTAPNHGTTIRANFPIEQPTTSPAELQAFTQYV